MAEVNTSEDKKYLAELIAELKIFFTLKPQDKEKAALNLNDNWQPSCRGYCNLSWETINVASSLMVLHHYADNPAGYYGLLRDILLDAEEQLKRLDHEDKMTNKTWTVSHPEWGDWEMQWSDETDFEKLDKVIGAQGFIFNDEGKFCVMKLSSKKKWLIIGGHPEKEDKTFEDTLRREVNEEADLEIKDIVRVGYVISYKKNNPQKKEYSLRYVARVAKINPQTLDPAYNEIPQRKFILPNEFDKYCGWGENGDFQMKKVLSKINLPSICAKKEKFIEIIEPTEKIFKIYKKFEAKIKKALPLAKTRLIGSFAVPICGKKEIDILVETENVEEAQNILARVGFVKGPIVKGEGFSLDNTGEIACDVHILLPADKKIRKVYDKVTNALKEDKILREKFEKLKRSLNGKSESEYKAAKSKFLEETIFKDWIAMKDKIK